MSRPKACGDDEDLSTSSTCPYPLVESIPSCAPARVITVLSIAPKGARGKIASRDPTRGRASTGPACGLGPAIEPCEQWHSAEAREDLSGFVIFIARRRPGAAHRRTVQTT